MQRPYRVRAIHGGPTPDRDTPVASSEESRFPTGRPARYADHWQVDIPREPPSTDTLRASAVPPKKITDSPAAALIAASTYEIR